MKPKPKYIIKDWTSNILNHKGRFELPCFVVPKTFETFEDAWDWIYTNIDDEEVYQDLFVELEDETT